MSEHTKGEWELGEFNYPDNGFFGRCEIRQDMGILAHVYLPAKNRSGYKEGQANAQLIASAPTLLNLCKEFMEMADNGSAAFDDPEPGSIYLRAEAAIAKCEA